MGDLSIKTTLAAISYRYMAPEVWLENLSGQQGSKAADVFSFGVVMWEVLHGRTAWDQYLIESGLPPKELATDFKAMMAFRPRFTTEVAEPLTPLVALGLQCLEEDPLRRPCFAEIRESLGAAMQALMHS